MKLKRDEIIQESELRVLSEDFLNESRCLATGSHYAAAIYLAAYALECRLKVAICRVIRQPVLTGMFKTHDLEGLLFYSGLQPLLTNDPVYSSFKQVVAIWNDKQGNASVRYASRVQWSEPQAKQFLMWVEEICKWLAAQN